MPIAIKPIVNKKEISVKNKKIVIPSDNHLKQNHHETDIFIFYTGSYF